MSDSGPSAKQFEQRSRWLQASKYVQTLANAFQTVAHEALPTVPGPSQTSGEEEPAFALDRALRAIPADRAGKDADARLESIATARWDFDLENRRACTAGRARTKEVIVAIRKVDDGALPNMNQGHVRRAQ